MIVLLVQTANGRVATIISEKGGRKRVVPSRFYARGGRRTIFSFSFFLRRLDVLIWPVLYVVRETDRFLSPSCPLALAVLVLTPRENVSERSRENIFLIPSQQDPSLH